MTTYRATITSPPPSPWTARPAMKTHMLVAAPESSRPTPNAVIPVASGWSGPRRSAHCPERTMANRLVVKYAEKANA